MISWCYCIMCRPLRTNNSRKCDYPIMFLIAYMEGRFPIRNHTGPTSQIHTNIIWYRCILGGVYPPTSPRPSSLWDYPDKLPSKQPASQPARQQGSKEARQQDSKPAGIQDLAVDFEIWPLTSYISSYRGSTEAQQPATGRHRPPNPLAQNPTNLPKSVCSRQHRIAK